jgi:hypothetical protein
VLGIFAIIEGRKIQAKLLANSPWGIASNLFHLIREMYLDKLAMAGGEGRALLRQIKYEALREYRQKNGWYDRRL